MPRRASEDSGRFWGGPGAVCGPRLIGGELRIVPEQGRAIFADDLGIVAHVAENMRVIERGPRPDAHELFRSDFDHRYAGLVVEMWYDVIGHAG